MMTRRDPVKSARLITPAKPAHTNFTVRQAQVIRRNRSKDYESSVHLFETSCL